MHPALLVCMHQSALRGTSAQTTIVFQVNQQRLKVVEAKEECVEHQQAELDAKAQLEAAEAIVAELTKRLEDAGQHVDKPAASGKVVRGQQKPKSGTAGPQSTAVRSVVSSCRKSTGRGRCRCR
jgi:hypothetical protein